MLQANKNCDTVLLLTVVALCCFGVVMVFSASSIMAEKRFHDSFFFFKRQALFAVVGFGVMYATMHINYHVWKRYAWAALLACLVMLAMVLLPGIGGTAGGSSRWIKLIYGFRFQPSEFAKIALIIYMAFSLDRKQDRVKSLARGFLPYMIVLMALLLLLLKQPDLGSAVTLFLVAFAMLFAAGTRLAHILSVGLLSLPFLYFLVMNVDYRRRRIMAFFDPWQDPQNSGFQIIQSLLAFGSGGLTGRGLGNGIQKLFYLPEAHTDFILAVIGEELGFLGVALTIGTFFVFLERSICIALAAPDIFGRFLAFGIAVLFAIEATFNIGVVTGMLPTKGLALPFISYGGSSLLMSLFAVGILLNISRGVKVPVSMFSRRAGE